MGHERGRQILEEPLYSACWLKHLDKFSLPEHKGLMSGCHPNVYIARRIYRQHPSSDGHGGLWGLSAMYPNPELERVTSMLGRI